MAILASAVAIFALAASGAYAADGGAREAFPALPAGSHLVLEISHPKRQVLRLRIQLPGVVALLLEDGQTGDTLLEVQGPGSLETAYQPPGARPPRVTLTLGRPELVGLEPEVVLPQPFDPVHLRLVFAKRDGSFAVAEITGTVGVWEALSLKWGETSCPTVTLTCTNGCHVTATCCSPRFCANCLNCDITCGQSCALP